MLFDITIRTLHGTFWLRPDAACRAIVNGVLGKALSLYKSVRLHVFGAQSNHLHYLLSATKPAEIPLFLDYVHGNIARQLNKLRGRTGTFWSRRGIAVIDDGAQADRFTYIVAQGTAVGLVVSPKRVFRDAYLRAAERVHADPKASRAEIQRLYPPGSLARPHWYIPRSEGMTTLTEPPRGCSRPAVAAPTWIPRADAPSLPTLRSSHPAAASHPGAVGVEVLSVEEGDAIHSNSPRACDPNGCDSLPVGSRRSRPDPVATRPRPDPTRRDTRARLVPAELERELGPLPIPPPPALVGAAGFWLSASLRSRHQAGITPRAATDGARAARTPQSPYSACYRRRR